MVIKKQFRRQLGAFFLSVFAVIAIGILFSSCTPKPYGPPERTSWTPDGPRSVPYIGDASDPAGGDVLGNPVGYFKSKHGDSINSDEIVSVAAPVFESAWIAEQDTVMASPAFDKSGNLYSSPFKRGLGVGLLVSLNPIDGSRRWVVESIGDPEFSTGGYPPLVLDDPDHPGEQIIYAGCLERAVAVKTDADINSNKIIETSEMVWDVSTGLTAVPGKPHRMFGLNYDPTTDTIIGFLAGNEVYVLDRKTGAPLLESPFSFPDAAPSPVKPLPNLPDFLMDRVADHTMAIWGIELENLAGTLLGDNKIIANYFSVDPHTGRIYVNATAPDGDDGAVDGVSELGALYCLKLVPAGGGLYSFDILYYITFLGGSAATPALSADGTKIYVADNFGKMKALDASDGSTIWEFDVGEQIFASISVASDNGEIYCSLQSTIVKVVDNGTTATESWRAAFDMYPKLFGSQNVNILTATICANGIAFQAGSSMMLGDLYLPISVGTGLMDRMTGEIRYFVKGREESVSITTVGPDGSIYIGHSPIRRMFSYGLYGDMVLEPIGGIERFAPKRLDLLMRDAVHAAADRANNVAVNGGSWTDDLINVEVKQIGILIDQCRAASVNAIADGDLTAGEWTTIDSYLTTAESALSSATPDFSDAYQNLQQADNLL